MAVMDEFKEERAALKNASFKEKLSYFVDYYKWHVIISICVVAFIASFVHQIVTAKDTALYAVMLNASPLTTDNVYAEEFAEYAGIDTQEYDLLFDTSIRITEGAMDEISYTSIEKLGVYTAAQELDVMISDGESIQKYANSVSFYDLRDILSAEQIAKYEPYFYYVDMKLVNEIEAANSALNDTYVPVYPDPTKPEEMTEPVPVGLFLDNNEKLQEYFYFRGESEAAEHVVLGVYCNTTRLDATLKYIDYVMGEAE